MTQFFHSKYVDFVWVHNSKLYFLCVKNVSSYKTSTHIKFLHIQNFSAFKSSPISNRHQGPQTMLYNMLCLVWFPGAELPIYQYCAKLSGAKLSGARLSWCQIVLMPNCHFLDIKFQTIEIQFFWAKSKIFQTFFNFKAFLSNQ